MSGLGHTDPSPKAPLVVLSNIALIADPDGTYGASWDGERAGGTWDHPNLDSVMVELNHVFGDWFPTYEEASRDA